MRDASSAAVAAAAASVLVARAPPPTLPQAEEGEGQDNFGIRCKLR